MRIGHFITGPVASGVAALTIVATQGMSGQETAGSLLLGYGGGWGLVFGVAAAIPMLFDPEARRSIIMAFVAFGAGGAMAGAIIVALLMSHNLGGSRTAVQVAYGIPLALPWLFGALITWAVGPKRLRLPLRPVAPRGLAVPRPIAGGLECPRCGLISPPDSRRCDCGSVFSGPT